MILAFAGGKLFQHLLFGRSRLGRLRLSPSKAFTARRRVELVGKERGITQDEAEQDFLNTTRPSTLINRFATTEEVANMVVYVCSEQSSGTTGTALRVDGGVVRSII